MKNNEAWLYTTWTSLMNITWTEQSQTPKGNTVQFHFLKAQKWAKLIYGDRSWSHDYPWDNDKGGFRVAGNVLKLIWEGGLNGCVQLVRIHWVVHLWFVYFSLLIFPWKAYAKFLSKRPYMTMPLPLPSPHFFFLFPFFWLHSVACGILVHWPGIEPTPPAVEIWLRPLDPQRSLSPALISDCTPTLLTPFVYCSPTHTVGCSLFAGFVFPGPSASRLPHSLFLHLIQV